MRMTLLILSFLFVLKAEAKIETTYYRALGNFQEAAKYPKGTQFESLIGKELDDVKRTISFYVVTFTPAKIITRNYHYRVSRIGDNWMITTIKPKNVAPYKLDGVWPFIKIKATLATSAGSFRYDISSDDKVYYEVTEVIDVKGVHKAKFESAGNKIDKATHDKLMKTLSNPYKR